MKKIYIICALVLALVAAMALTAQAYRIDFEIAAVQTGASTKWLGGATPLIGTNLVIDKITGIDTPLNAGNANALTSTNGLWNFTSGPFTGSATDHWFFDSSTGSSTSMTGTFTKGATNVINPILSGTFINADVHNTVAGGVFSYVISGTFRDIKSTDLLAYFGVPGSNPYTATFNYGIFLNGDIQPPTTFASLFVSSGDINNFPVPVPPSAILLGTGLLGLVGLRFRRK